MYYVVFPRCKIYSPAASLNLSLPLIFQTSSSEDQAEETEEFYVKYRNL